MIEQGNFGVLRIYRTTGARETAQIGPWAIHSFRMVSPKTLRYPTKSLIKLLSSLFLNLPAGGGILKVVFRREWCSIGGCLYVCNGLCPDHSWEGTSRSNLLQDFFRTSGPLVVLHANRIVVPKLQNRGHTFCNTCIRVMQASTELSLWPDKHIIKHEIMVMITQCEEC